MSVIERTTNVQRPERAVFVTDDDRRARRLRRGAFAVTALACVWLGGLGVGMLGFGSLPGVSLITPGDGKRRVDAPAKHQARGDVARLSRAVHDRRLVARQAQARRAARASALQHRAAAAVPRSSPVSRPAARPAAVVPRAQQPVNPAQRQRGWARKGQPAPPGRLRTHPPPPASSQGQRRGQETATTSTPLPPGQAKKTPPPPPPPPPG
jgi:hypothetical protein